MRKLVVGMMLSAFVAFVAGEALAHSEGHEPVNDKQSIEIAAEVVVSLTERDANRGFGKLAASWISLPAESRKIHAKGDGSVVVSIRNDAEGKTLYVLMSNAGDVLDANLTGKFSQLDKS
jgi:hypothetical protein